jgi:hypothetical protein
LQDCPDLSTDLACAFAGVPGPELVGELAAAEVAGLHPLQRSWG